MATPTDTAQIPAKPTDNNQAAQPDQTQQAEKALMQQQEGIKQNIERLYSEMKENQQLGLQGKADELERDVNTIMTAYNEQQNAPAQKSEPPKKKKTWLSGVLGTTIGAIIGAVAAYFGSTKLKNPTPLKIGAVAGIPVGIGAGVGSSIANKFSGNKESKEAAQPAGNGKLAALVTTNAALEQLFMKYMQEAQSHVQEMMASGKLPMPGMPGMPPEMPDQEMPADPSLDQSMSGQPDMKDVASETPVPASAQASSPTESAANVPSVPQPRAAMDDIKEEDTKPVKQAQAAGAGTARG